MELKCTLMYSNPQLIRQIKIPDRFILKDLGKAIDISVVKIKKEDYVYWKNNIKISQMKVIDEELFKDDERVYAKVEDADTLIWYWRIEKVKECDEIAKDEEYDYPVVTRLFAGTIPRDARNTKEMNFMKNAWFFVSDMVDIEELNKKLKQAFTKTN